jgi:hypothetical protein
MREVPSAGMHCVNNSGERVQHFGRITGSAAAQCTAAGFVIKYSNHCTVHTDGLISSSQARELAAHGCYNGRCITGPAAAEDAMLALLEIVGGARPDSCNCLANWLCMAATVEGVSCSDWACSIPGT